MNYSEYKKTYKQSIKKWPDITTLFDRDDVRITCTRETWKKYAPAGSWHLEESKTMNHTWINYTNTIDAHWFFKNLSSYSRVNCNYTKYGRIPVKCIDISPDGMEKVIFKFSFE